MDFTTETHLRLLLFVLRTVVFRSLTFFFTSSSIAEIARGTFATLHAREACCEGARSRETLPRSIAVKSAGSLQSMRYGAHKELQHH